MTNLVYNMRRFISANQSAKVWSQRHRNKVRQTQRPSRPIDQIVMRIRWMINDITASATRRPTLKAA